MMKRLTSDDTKSIFYDLNLFFAKDNEVWIRGGGPEPDYQDCTLVNWIGRVADKHNLEIYARDAVNLGDEMYDCLQYGIDTIEGVVALLHAAAVQATTMRSRLKEIEDILGDDYDLDRLKELVEADREGRCEVIPREEFFLRLNSNIYVIDDGEVLEVLLYIIGRDQNGIGFIDVVYLPGYENEKRLRFRFSDVGKTVFLTREEAEARAEKAERERDAAVFDLLRAEEAAEETNALLDDEVHPACDYSLYLAVHDSVSDIVNWERDDVWRGHKEEENEKCYAKNGGKQHKV